MAMASRTATASGGDEKKAASASGSSGLLSPRSMAAAQTVASAGTSPAPAVQNVGVRVVVRVRPPIASEGEQSTALLKVKDAASIAVSVPSKQTNTGKDSTAGVAGSGNGARAVSHSFAFDGVLNTATTQSQVFERAGVASIVEGVLNGFHGTIFAYGQTGSGKTYTMDGLDYGPTSELATASGGNESPRNPTRKADRDGVSMRSIQTLFDLITARQSKQLPTATASAAAAGDVKQQPTDNKSGGSTAVTSSSDDQTRYTVRCSFVQIYQENVYDLLSASSAVDDVDSLPGLRVRWSADREFYVENMFVFECHSAADARDYFLRGVRKRITAAHRLNAHSSRSHSLFTLYVDSQNSAYPDQSRSSRLTLVDLAGSERQHVTGATGVVMKQSIAVNKSLFVLRQVIQALAKEQSSASAEPATPLSPHRATTAGGDTDGGSGSSGNRLKHIPFRDSVLTRLLKHSLGGSCLTVMIACLCPTDAFVDENLSTLNYGALAKRISNPAVINEDPKVALIRKLRAENAQLKQMLVRANEMISIQTRLATAAAGGRPSNALLTSSGSDTVGSGSGTHDRNASIGDGGALKEKLIDSVAIIRELMTDNKSLRVAFVDGGKQKEALEFSNRILNEENAELRDRIHFLEAVIVDGKVEMFGTDAGDELDSKDVETELNAQLHAQAQAQAHAQAQKQQQLDAATTGARPSASERFLIRPSAITPASAAAASNSGGTHFPALNDHSPPLKASPRSGGGRPSAAANGTSYSVAIPVINQSPAPPSASGKGAAPKSARRAAATTTPAATGAGARKSKSPAPAVGSAMQPTQTATWQELASQLAAPGAVNPNFNFLRGSSLAGGSSGSGAAGSAAGAVTIGGSYSGAPNLALARTYQRLYGRRRMNGMSDGKTATASGAATPAAGAASNVSGGAAASGILSATSFTGLLRSNAPAPPTAELTAVEKEQLVATQRAVRLQSEQWLRSHPEFNTLISDFVLSALQHQPKDVEAFAVDYFCKR